MFCLDARKHCEICLNCSAKFSKSQLVRSQSALDFFRSSNGQVVTELHISEMHASGPGDTLEKLEGESGERTSVKHAMIFCATAIETLDNLRRERILTPEGCVVRSDCMWGVLRHCWAWRRANLSLHTLQPATEMIW